MSKENRREMLGVPHDKASAWAYGVYAALSGTTILLSADKFATVPPGLRGKLRGLSGEPEDIPGGFYRLHGAVVEASARAVAPAAMTLLERLYRTLFGSVRAISLVRRSQADLHFAILRAGMLRDAFATDSALLIPNFGAAQAIVRREALAPVATSTILGILWIACQLLFLVVALGRSMRFRPSSARPAGVRLLKSLLRGFAQKAYRDDVLVDGINVKSSEVAFFVAKTAAPIAGYVAQAHERGYPVEVLGDPRFSWRSRAFVAYATRFASGILIATPLTIILAPEALSGLVNLASLAPDRLRLLSRINAAYVMDDGDEANGIVMPMVCDWLGSKAVLLSHTCDTDASHYVVAYASQQVLFVWGRNPESRAFRNALNDEVWAVGCMMANCFRGAQRDELRQGIAELAAGRKLTTWFDNSFGVRFAEKDYREFMEAAIDFARTNPDVQVVVKAKQVVPPAYAQELAAAGAKVLAATDIWLGDMIEISDACVGMGVTNVTQIALFRGAQTIMFDTTGFRHPLYEPYEGKLVVRDKAALFARLREILDCTAPTPRVPELDGYNVPSVDTFSLISRYLKEGVLPEEFRVPERQIAWKQA
jgi:hypothetical protein